MKEWRQILELWSRAQDSKEQPILATVLKTAGSSYRIPGARLLVTRDGRRAGSVSGGCLEDDIAKKAWWLTADGPVIRRYDTTPDGELDNSGFGLGCNGIIHVLLECDFSALHLIQCVMNDRRPAVIAHTVAPANDAGQRLVIDTNGASTSNIADAALAKNLEEEARAAISTGESRRLRVGDREFFIETLLPPVRLLVFGAGDDARPLVQLAKFLGWEIFVCDGRSHLARPDRFPAADRVIHRFGTFDLLSLLDNRSVAVLMHHSYSQDGEVLKQLAAAMPLYVGVLGPRRRTEQLMEDAGLNPEILAGSLHGPMGLDIGADGPEQVALSIVAEIQAALAGCEGGSLRCLSRPIHVVDGDAHRPWLSSIVCV